MSIGVNEGLISVREAARECGRNMETVRRWIWGGKLPAEKLGNQLFIRREDFNAFCHRLNKAGQKTTAKPDFLKRAMSLQSRIRRRIGTGFDSAALVRESRKRLHG